MSYSSPIPVDVMADLRTDHAGETGAVWIYRGILAVSKDPVVCKFALSHLQTEKEHLAQMNDLVPREQRSKLLGPWKLAGFLTGAVPAMVGPKAVYSTIQAVETFVDKHYDEQVKKLASLPEQATLKEVLQKCQADECQHRDEAAQLTGFNWAVRPGLGLRAWCKLVSVGSEVAVKIARRV